MLDNRFARWPLLRLPPLTPWLLLAPALLLVGALFCSTVIYGVLQSLGYLPFINQNELSLAAYENLLLSDSAAAAEFYPALLFSLWVSVASTLIAAAVALLIVMIFGEHLHRNRGGLLALNINLAFPHLVWAIGISLLLAQSGLLARLGAWLGLMSAPADFPVLVRDTWGLGIILSYASKEIPFLLLILLSILRAQSGSYMLVAANLGASRWQILRYVTLPLVLPGLSAGALLAFAFVFGAYEVPALLGVRFPRMLSVLAVEFFRNPDLRSRAEGMAISVILAAITLLVAGAARYLTMRNEER